MPAVPAFMLKKLYLRGSLKNTGDGFQFQIRNCVNRYRSLHRSLSGGVSHIDTFDPKDNKHAGKIMDAIRAEAPNTIVIITADNGAWQDAWPDAGTVPFRGEKGSPFEGGFRVPGIMWAPGKIPAGARYGEMMSHIDAWATLAAMVGLTPPPHDCRGMCSRGGQVRTRRGTPDLDLPLGAAADGADLPAERGARALASTSRTQLSPSPRREKVGLRIPCKTVRLNEENIQRSTFNSERSMGSPRAILECWTLNVEC